MILSDCKLQQHEKRLNSLKRIEQSYDYMIKGINTANDDDLIILSDNDEIPNLNSKLFKKTKKNIIIFKQLFIKLNLTFCMTIIEVYKRKLTNGLAYKIKRHLKNKKYPFWRMDTYFSKLKNINLEIIDDGGWHFTNVKTPKELFEKMKNFGHHDEFDLSGLSIDDLKMKIQNRKVFYDHFADQSKTDKWTFDYDLKKINEKYNFIFI